MAISIRDSLIRSKPGSCFAIRSQHGWAGPEPECRESKEDQEKSNAHCCWEILEGKVGVDVNDLYPLPERELLCFLHQDTGEEPPDDSNYG